MLRYFFGTLFLNQVNCLPILDNFNSKILNAGELFILYFDNKLDLSINYNNCSNIFETNTIAKLGSQPICRVFSKNSIKLIPSQDAVLAFGDSLDFDNISISSDIPFLIENFTDAYQKPFIKINGPNSYCRCPTSINDNLKVNVDLSNLTGYASLKNIKWHIYDNEFADGNDLFAVELEVFQGLSEITIQSNWFTASQDYYIFVYGENVFGNNGSALKRINFSKDCLPYVEIHLNSMYSDDDSIALKATVIYPLCSNQTQIFYPDWFLIDIDLPPVIDISSDLLYIPHTVLSTASSGSYSWRCLFENKACIQKSKNMVFPTYNYLEMNLQPSDLFPNSQFTIEVKYTSNGLISTSSVNIMVLSGNVPVIKIKAKKNKVSYSESVTFIADVENVHTSFNYSWSCRYKYDDTNQELNLETPTLLEVVNFVDGRVPSVIKHFPSYYFDYGRIVVCKFSFLYENQIIYAYEEVEIVMPIKNVNIIASPHSGLAYEDKFRFRVYGWHQSNVYLFRFGFYAKYNTDKESDKVYKSMWSAQNWVENVQFFMEKGNGPGNKLKIFCEIIDNQGFITTITTDIVVIPLIAENRVKIAKKAFDFAYYLQTDQLQCAEYLLDIIPLANLSNLLGSDPQRIQTNLVLYLTKLRRQGFIALLVTKAMDVIYKFVYATKGNMNPDTLKNITSTLNYISVNILTVRQEIDAIKMAKQLIDISNILVNSSGNLKVVLSETPSIIKGFLNVAGSNYDNQQESFHGSFISGLFVLERFLFRASTSVLTLNNNLKNKYRKWQCQNKYPFNCTGMLVVQAQYDYNLFSNKTFGEDWQPVSNVYELALFNPVTFEKLNTDDDVENFYEILLPLKYLQLSNTSYVQCQVWNVARSMFDPTLCYYFAYIQEEHVLCRCKRLGKIVALYQEGAFPTTESIKIDPNLSYTFYFHMDFDPYCLTITRMKSVTNKFSYQLQQYIIARGLLVWPKLKLDLRRSRLVVVNCLNGGFGISTINMTIKDRYGELRNWFIKQEIKNLVVNQAFKIQMKQGGDIALFDVNQTTAKPTITIPPIEEIKTNWIPFIAVVLMFFFIFLVLAFWKYFHQTRLFAQMVYTDVNKYKPKKLSEVEKEKQANKKIKIERINTMHMEGFVAEEKSRSNNKIRPVNEAAVMGGSFFFRDSPILDSEPRSSLDEFDNENIFTSKIMLIKAASINALNDFNTKNLESECVEK
ncbi:uncharacterized protein LOC101236729 isoform X4 [Hydra vulgaris]|uniref:Uncharacterized protein LOC101236729 isoform X4 n=1 Tax=Hydra vulgaris TaxID=6087 RepID=A0ABM4CCE8_HYDVU